MASLADNVARVISVFNALKSKVKSYVAMNDFLNPLKIEEYVNAIDDVFTSGVANGKQSQYDEFWDAFQQNGNRTDYAFAFTGHIWDYFDFKPKYDIFPTSAYNMFNVPYLDSKEPLDLFSKLKDAGVTLDFSKCTKFQYMFNSYPVTHIGIVDTTSVIGLSTQVFWQCNKLHTIEKLIIKNDGTTIFNEQTFGGCIALKNLIIEGVIGNNIYFNACPLSKDSIISIFDALSTTVTDKTLTLKKSAVNTAFGINVDDTSTYTDEWKSLTESKKNWNIAYV